MAEQPRKRGSVEQLCRQEFDFLQRWRELVDKVGGDGGQTRVATRLKWSTSTVSRDYAGVTLPSDARRDEISDYLRLTKDQRIELAVLLQRARDARQTRRKVGSVESGCVSDSTEPPLAAGAVTTLAQQDQVSGHKDAAFLADDSFRLRRSRHPRWIGVVVAVVVIAAATTGVLVWRPWEDGPVSISGTSGVVATYPGAGLKAVTIPVTALSPPLAAAFRQGGTSGSGPVTGYEFRNADDEGLCLTAVDTGPLAGRNGDRVEVATCGLAASQIWIPEQWEINGRTFTHLVSDRYQSMCLNADNLGGLNDGHRVQLWDCYPATNESWDFGDWYWNVKPGVHSYPLLLQKDHFCLDADKYDFGAGDAVNIWTQYATANQFWS